MSKLNDLLVSVKLSAQNIADDAIVARRIEEVDKKYWVYDLIKEFQRLENYIVELKELIK